MEMDFSSRRASVATDRGEGRQAARDSMMTSITQYMKKLEEKEMEVIHLKQEVRSLQKEKSHLQEGRRDVEESLQKMQEAHKKALEQGGRGKEAENQEKMRELLLEKHNKDIQLLQQEHQTKLEGVQAQRASDEQAAQRKVEAMRKDHEAEVAAVRKQRDDIAMEKQKKEEELRKELSEKDALVSQVETTNREQSGRISELEELKERLQGENDQRIKSALSKNVADMKDKELEKQRHQNQVEELEKEIAR
mmetsp:Transcript_3504/g.3868  ORF Transcript_3504/g.3868 Transcript_3504/m.3868 type:complete len:250 (+) Transcript_3504:120-869(+)